MKNGDYIHELDEINKEHNRAQCSLYKKYALGNNTIQPGDLIKDHMGSIKVDRILFIGPSGGSMPQCIYRGVEYTAKGKPFKNKAVRDVYQGNLKNLEL